MTSEGSPHNLDQTMADAARCFAERRWPEARAGYRAADAMMAEESSARRGVVLARLGHIELMTGSKRKAVELLDRALGMAPDNPIALAARATIALGSEEHALGSALLYRLLPMLQDKDERRLKVQEMVAASLEAARLALSRAVELEPDDVELYEKLRDVQAAAGHWAAAVSASVALAERLQSRRRRAEALVAAADMCADKEGNTQRAVALYEAAIQDDPRVEGAFDAIEAVLADSLDYPGLIDAYERQLERLMEAGADDDSIALLKKLALVHHENLADTRAAVAALDRIAELRPHDLEARAMLADLLSEIGEHALAIRCLELSARHAPKDAGTYRKLFELLSEEREDDRAYAAGAVLVALGQARTIERDVYNHSAPDAPLRPRQPFDDDVWAELQPEEHSADLDELFALIEAPAIALSLERGDAVLPNESLRQDPESATIMAVRCFAWAAELLQVPSPAIYAEPKNTRVTAATLPTVESAVLLGRPILAGRSIVELSYVATHHLSHHRPGWRLLTHFPRTGDLNTLLRAAMAIAEPRIAASLAAPAQAAHRALDARLSAAHKTRLASVVGRLVAAGATVDLKSWQRSVELTSCRAALLATGDVNVAASVLSLVGGAAAVTAAACVEDLYAFSISQRYAALRHLLGLSVSLDDAPPSLRGR